MTRVVLLTLCYLRIHLLVKHLDDDASIVLASSSRAPAHLDVLSRRDPPTKTENKSQLERQLLRTQIVTGFACSSRPRARVPEVSPLSEPYFVF